MFWGCEFLEKFGIFELLDTLSAILAGENAPSAAQKPSAQPSPAQVEPHGEAQSGAQGAAASSAPHAGEQTPQGAAALSSFLARHDAVSKKIDGK